MANEPKFATRKFTEAAVYKHISGDSSNDGISSRYNYVYLFAESCTDAEISATIRARKLDPARVMKVRRRQTSFGDCIEAIPFPKGGKWWMFGGCYICGYSNVPSTWDEVVGDHRPLAMFDRCEQD